MRVFLIVAAGLAAVYLFAAIAFYQAFKNWTPMCGSRPAKGLALRFLNKAGRGAADAGH